MDITAVMKRTYRILSTHHSDRGADIRDWPLMPRLGWYGSMIGFGLFPGILAFVVITPQSVPGWLLTGVLTLLGCLVWIDNGRLRFSAPARAAVYALIYSWLCLAFLTLIWPISVDDIVAMSLAIAAVAILGLVASGIPSWVWRGSNPPSWAVAANRFINRPISSRLGRILGSTMGEALLLVLLVLGFWSLVLF